MRGSRGLGQAALSRAVCGLGVGQTLTGNVRPAPSVPSCDWHCHNGQALSLLLTLTESKSDTYDVATSLNYNVRLVNAKLFVGEPLSKPIRKDSDSFRRLECGNTIAEGGVI